MELPAPGTLAIHDKEAAERWRVFKLAWESYSLARGVTDKDEDVQVATLLTVIGEDARTVYQTFQFDNAGDEKKIAPVLKKFEDYCSSQGSMYHSQGTCFTSDSSRLESRTKSTKWSCEC